MRIYNMLEKEFQDDIQKLNPNHLAVINLQDKNSMETFIQNNEMFELNPKIFYEIKDNQITIYDNNSYEPYNLTMKFNGSMEESIEKYLDEYEEMKWKI